MTSRRGIGAGNVESESGSIALTVEIYSVFPLLRAVEEPYQSYLVRRHMQTGHSRKWIPQIRRAAA